jgi:hypothetical protein|tara:strand:+ start:2947 stop:3462 length:516 start_codon:yes stop_codon:yes gene_type:complete
MPDENSKKLTKVDRLTIRERRFLHAYLREGLSATDAYLLIATKVITTGSARELGSRLLKRIKKKVEWTEMLDAADLGLDRLAGEMNRMLRMQKVVHYQGEEVGTYEDSGTQMRAVDLLADLLGQKKSSSNRRHGGEDGGPILIDFVGAREKLRKALEGNDSDDGEPTKLTD